MTTQPKNATCRVCRRRMNPGTECRITEYEIGGKVYARIPFNLDDADVPCRDCGVTKGGIHHPLCCLEECPVPGHGQRLMCRCGLD